VIKGGDGVVDDVLGIMASTRVRLATSETSCGGGEWRPETEMARVSTRRAQHYKNSNDLMHKGLRQREGRRMVQERGRRDPSLHRNRRGLAAALWSFSEEFARPGGVVERGKERDERGERGL
jgi:hypothetical protein